MSGILRAAGVAALTLTVLAPTAAYADHWRSTDTRRDVDGFSYNPNPEPCGTTTDLDGAADTNTDITRLGVRHTRRAVVATTRFRDLDPALEQVLSVNIRSSTGGWELFLIREPEPGGGSDVFVDLSTEPEYPDPDDVPECGSFSVISEGVPCRIGRDIDLEADLIRMTVPRKCLGNPRWVRVAASAYRFIGSEDPNDPTFSIFWDDWDGGTELSEWLPPFGPRVPATTGAEIGGTRTARSTGERHTFVVRRDGKLTRR